MTVSNIITIVLSFLVILGGTIMFAKKHKSGTLTVNRLILGLIVMAVLGVVLGFELGEVFYK